MRIVKFLLFDLLCEFLFSILFLFNSANDLRVNILLAISIGVAGLVFEFGLLFIYVVSSITGVYSRIAHAMLFSIFIIYVNVISLLYFKDGEVIDLRFYGFILFSSLVFIFVYYRIIESFASGLSEDDHKLD